MSFWRRRRDEKVTPLAFTFEHALNRACAAAQATGRRHQVRQERFGTLRLWRWTEVES